jgi:adenylylsulfate kinase
MAMTDSNVSWHPGLTRERRWELLGCRGATLWFTGLSASGKSTIATAVEDALVERQVHCLRLDGDNMRHGLNSDLGFAPEDREENIRRLGEVAKLLAVSGAVAIVSAISPYRAHRDRARAIHAAEEIPFIEVYVNTPVEVCEIRDPKGLYKKARAGLIRDFTGIDAPYEAPPAPELLLEPHHLSPDECVAKSLEVLKKFGIALE